MKRYLKLSWLLAALLLVLVACGGGGETAAPEPTAATEGLPAATLPAETAATLPPPVVEGEILPTPTLAAPTEGGEAVPAEQPAVAPEAEVGGPWPADQFGYGIQIHGNATVGDPAATMQAVRDQLGLSWVKMQVQWWLSSPTRPATSGSSTTPPLARPTSTTCG